MTTESGAARIRGIESAQTSETTLSDIQLRRLLEVGRSLVADLDTESVLMQILEAARELTGARYAALGILDDEKRALERFLVTGIDPDTRKEIGSLPQGHGVLGELIRDPRPLRLERVGEHPHSFGFPPGHPPMDTFVGVPVKIRGEAFGNIYLTEKSGGHPFDEVDEAMLVVLAEWAAVAIANARLYEQSEGRRRELERAVQALEATVALSRLGATENDFSSLHELVAKRARALVECGAVVLLVPDDGGVVRVGAAAGEGEFPPPGEPVSGAAELFAAARRRRESILIREPEPGLSACGIDTSGAILEHLESRGVTHGYLLFTGPGAATFSEEEKLVLAAFSNSAAMSLSLARDVERDRARMALAASERERRRWAMELHDETLQDLGALKVMQEAALSLGDRETLERSLTNATEQLDGTIARLESLIQELRPASLDALGVEAAVETLITRLSTRSGAEIKLESSLRFESGEESERLAGPVEATIYRLVQEALNNSLKHGEARHIGVGLDESDGSVLVWVRDDGKGFDPERVPLDRFGLHGMKERVDLAGGSLRIESAPSRGTLVEARIPANRNDPG